MHVTKYGQTIANDRAALEAHTGGRTGASAHAAACSLDTGMEFVLTGTDFSGKRFTRTARSMAGAWFTMLAVAGINNAWHVRADGSRKLAIRR